MNFGYSDTEPTELKYFSLVLEVIWFGFNFKSRPPNFVRLGLNAHPRRDAGGLKFLKKQIS